MRIFMLENICWTWRRRALECQLSSNGVGPPVGVATQMEGSEHAHQAAAGEAEGTEVSE